VLVTDFDQVGDAGAGRAHYPITPLGVVALQFGGERSGLRMGRMKLQVIPP